MKAAKKATLVMLLAMGASIPAAQAQAPSIFMAPPPVQSESYAPVVQKQVRASELTFSEVSDRDALVKKYPVLQSLVSTLADDNKTSPAIPNSIDIATFQDSATKTSFLFVKIGGSSYCQASGCMISIYKDSGSGGYHEVTPSIVGYEPVSVVHGDGNLSVQFLTDNNSTSLWDLHGYQLEYIKTVAPPTKAPAPRR